MSDLSLTNDYIEATDRIARHVLTQEIKQRAESSTLPPVTYNTSAVDIFILSFEDKPTEDARIKQLIEIL